MDSSDDVSDAHAFEWLSERLLKGGESAPESPSEGFEHVIETFDDRPDRCIIYPREREDDRDISEWIAAREGSYVTLTANR